MWTHDTVFTSERTRWTSGGSCGPWLTSGRLRTMRRTRTPPPASRSTAGQTNCGVSEGPASSTSTGFHHRCVCAWHFYLCSSCVPSVWPGQRWQNLTGWTAAGECLWRIDTTDDWNKPLTMTHHKIIYQLLNVNLCLCWMIRLVQTLCNALLVLETVSFANLMWPIAMTSLGLTLCVYRKTHFGVS